MVDDPTRPSDDAASRRIGDAVRTGERVISFEFMPPRDEAGVAQLWTAIRELEPYAPTFVSVTYGAGGTTRDTTVEITGRIARETTLRAMGHLTCVGHTRDELGAILDSYAAAGVENVLALRGDPREGPRAPWTATEGGLTYACARVELVHARGDLSVGVAAFPEGHPSAESLQRDAEVLLDKQRAGAEFAITDMVFRAQSYAELVARATAIGVEIPILPGIMPILSLPQVSRMAELSGRRLPTEVVDRVRVHEGDPAAIRAEGVRIATELCEELLAAGAPGLHFFTLNRSRATREVFDALRITTA